MAYSDRAGRVKTASKKFTRGLEGLRADINESVNRTSNLEVGDFLTELLTVMRTRIKTGLREGDWIEDPERAYTDGAVFGEETRVASEVKLQIALCVDVSKSTYYNGVAAIMGEAVLAIDRVIRKAMAELPEGALTYRVFAFNRNTYLVPEQDVILLDTRSPDEGGSTIQRWGTWFIQPEGGEKISGLTVPQVAERAKQYNAQGRAWKHGYDHNWNDTLVAPLFSAIEAWEQAEGDHHAQRIDLILSDGELDNVADVKEATKIQERRNGKLTTFMLNFLPRSKWGQHALPQRCYQYQANQEYLGQQIQQIISDSLLEMT